MATSAQSLRCSRLIANQSAGDVRQALSRLETAAAAAMAAGETEVTARTIELVTGAALQRYDRDQHYASSRCSSSRFAARIRALPCTGWSGYSRRGRPRGSSLAG
ncbi:hypothetical protein [Streptomyces chartreusis]|uniref:hypothetical protein n=1 Tax=Streptomyces chartreusis TaxID=1969 RepID=UPI0036807C51